MKQQRRSFHYRVILSSRDMYRSLKAVENSKSADFECNRLICIVTQFLSVKMHGTPHSCSDS